VNKSKDLIEQFSLVYWLCMVSSIHKEARNRIIASIVTAFGIVVGLAWNEAIGSLIQTYIPLGKGTMTAKFIYAIVLTIAVVLITQYLTKLISKEE